MKCQYVGGFSTVGCNEDAILGERFCHAHLMGRREIERNRKIIGGCLVVLLGLVVVCSVCIASMSN